jgi:hypothetical protein
VSRPNARPPAASTEEVLERLDRLEELLELMDELNVSTRTEAEAMLAKLEAEIDDDEQQ